MSATSAPHLLPVDRLAELVHLREDLLAIRLARGDFGDVRMQDGVAHVTLDGYTAYRYAFNPELPDALSLTA